MSKVTFAPNENYLDPEKNLVYAIAVRSLLKQQAVTVTTTPTKVPGTPLSSRLTLLIYNNGAVIIYIGDSTVTSNNGIPLLPQSSFPFTVEDDVDIYAVAASGTCDVRVLETK